jgi:hypothetical protein
MGRLSVADALRFHSYCHVQTKNFSTLVQGTGWKTTKRSEMKASHNAQQLIYRIECFDAGCDAAITSPTAKAIWRA